MRCYDNLNVSPKPCHGSWPILMLLPSPICHATQFPIKGKATTKSFQHKDPPLCDLTNCLNNSSIDELGQYFTLIVLPHSDLGFSTIHHKDLAAKALQKRSRFLIPQPPLDLGRTKVVHFTNGIPSAFLLVVHRKDRHFS